MENNQINIAKTCQEIEKIKYPSIFLFNLIAHKNDFDDYDLSIILRIFMKYNSNFMLEYNIKKIFENEVSQYSLSWCGLCDFYKIISKKITLVFILKKFHSVYENKFFW